MILFSRPPHGLFMARLVDSLRTLTPIAAGLLAVAALSTLAGCTHVRPYERGALARPTMTSAPLTGAGEEHVYSVHEGATGGGGGGGGGCGCN